MGTLKIYEYNQNNSGGWFEFNENLTTNVYIEAKSLEEANEKVMNCIWKQL